jgi:hypothetical protein
MFPSIRTGSLMIIPNGCGWLSHTHDSSEGDRQSSGHCPLRELLANSASF